MSANYVVSRIKEALYNAKGNKKIASQQIMAWAMDDMQLLKGLTRAHLGGIVAYNIERVASGKAGDDNSHAQLNQTPNSSRKMVNPKDSSEFGRELLKTVSKGVVFGLESYETPTAPVKTSQRHIDTLNHIASFSKGKF